MLNGSSKLFQELSDGLRLGYQLGMVCHGQLVVPEATFKSLNKLLLDGYCADSGQPALAE
jgi:hypothetical protein